MTLGVDSRDPVLWDLCGSASLELELGRQAFARMWDDYNFKVKTYQETMVSAVEFLEIRAEAAVRRQSSFIGNPRESAETIAASHLDMCKFSSADDSGYRSLANALARYVRVESNHRHTITPRELECLAALARKQVPLYEPHASITYPGTCLWLYDLPEFQAWYHRTDRNKNKVLWIKGQSGSGKSVLLRALRNRIEKQWTPAGGSIIWARAGGLHTNEIFFPGSCVQHVGTGPSSVYRSLLTQLFLQDPHLRKALVSLYEKQCDTCSRPLDDASVVSFFVDDYIDSSIETPSRRTFIFIDVSDCCGSSYLRDLLSHLSQLARNSDFSICVASGNPLNAVQEENAIEVFTQHRNADDILRYINITLIAEWEERNLTVVRIGQKAAGVFLWAEIVVNILNAAIGEGASQDMIEYTLEEMPGDLHGLYEWMLSTLNDREKREALVLFQWVILAAEPLRLNDLLVAVRLTKTWDPSTFRPYMALEQDAPSSMRELRKIRNSEVTTDNPHQFNRWIRARSIGLLELRSSSEHLHHHHHHHHHHRHRHRDGVVNESLGLQRVQATHDSVRTFFLSGRGFACLSPSPSPLPPSDLIDMAHYALLNACLTYLNMRDFEPLASSSSSSHPRSPLSPLSPAADIIPTTTQQRQNVHDQRALITSSYPFLAYAVRNLLFHLLSPSQFRYFLPQSHLLRTLSANRCRLWRRWTSLLGCADPGAVIRLHLEAAEEGVGGAGGPVGALLSPVFGARFRLERVFRRLARMVAAVEGAAAAAREGGIGGGGGVVVLSPGLFPAPPQSSARGVPAPGEAPPGSAGSERTVWGGMSVGGSEGSVQSPIGNVKSRRGGEKGKDPVSPLSPYSDVGSDGVPLRSGKGKVPPSPDWRMERTGLSPQREKESAAEWPLTPESDYTSHYSSQVMSGYSSHYSDQAMSGFSSGYSSKRSPLRMDTFQALDGVGVGIDARVEVGFGMARSM